MWDWTEPFNHPWSTESWDNHYQLLLKQTRQNDAFGIWHICWGAWWERGNEGGRRTHYQPATPVLDLHIVAGISLPRRKSLTLWNKACAQTCQNGLGICQRIPTRIFALQTVAWSGSTNYRVSPNPGWQWIISSSRMSQSEQPQGALWGPAFPNSSLLFGDTVQWRLKISILALNCKDLVSALDYEHKKQN